MKIKTLNMGEVAISIMYTSVIWLATLHGNTTIKSMLSIYFTVLTILLGIFGLFVSRKDIVKRGVFISSNRFHFLLLIKLIEAISIAYMGFSVLASAYFILSFLALGKRLEYGA